MVNFFFLHFFLPVNQVLTTLSPFCFMLLTTQAKFSALQRKVSVQSHTANQWKKEIDCMLLAIGPRHIPLTTLFCAMCILLKETECWLEMDLTTLKTKKKKRFLKTRCWEHSTRLFPWIHMRYSTLPCHCGWTSKLSFSFTCPLTSDRFPSFKHSCEV